MDFREILGHVHKLEEALRKKLQVHINGNTEILLLDIGLECLKLFHVSFALLVWCLVAGFLEDLL